MRTSKIRIGHALATITSKRWIDGSAIDNIRYVWPDEGFWIITGQVAYSSGWVDDIFELESEFCGKAPVFPRVSHGYRCRILEFTNRNGDHCEYISSERLVLLPEGSIIFERFLDDSGAFRQQVTISTTNNNPQPRFDFDNGEVLLLPLALPLAA